jgi:tetratricopeptide (TPR) repeat protein
VIRGLCISSLGNPTEAIPDFRYGLQRFPGNVEWRMHLAFVLSEAHRYKDAAAQFERVLPHLSNSKYARLGLARCLGALNEPARAKELLDGLVAEDPKFTDALVERGHLALQTDRPEEAEKDLSRALTINPCDREALFLREQGLRRLGRSSEASQMAARMHRVEETGMRIQQLIQRSTPASMRDPAYCTERGKLVLENGKEAEGLFWLFRALKVQRNYPPALKALVEHYTKKGDKQEAAKYRRLLGESG